MATTEAVVRTLLFWLAIGPLMVSIGGCVRRLFRLHWRCAEDLTMDAWVGWGTVVCGLQFWHACRPVDDAAFLAFVVFGLLAAAFGWSDAWRLCARVQRGVIVAIGVLLVSLLWVASQTTSQSSLVDSGVYHVPAVKWINSYAIVPGLGNLSDWLAINSSYFLYAALMDFGWFKSTYHHVGNGMLVVFLLARLCVGGYRVFSSAHPVRLHHVFDLMFLVPLLWHVEGAYGFVSSPTPDLAVYLLQVVALSETLKLIDHANADAATSTAEEDVYSTFVVVLVNAVGVSVKLSHAGFALASSLFVLAVAFKRVHGRLSRGKILAAACLGCLLILVPWACRGVVLSGYPAYPSAICGANVSWRMPESRVEAHERLIRAWGRKFGSVPFEEVPAGSTRIADKVLERPWLWLWLNQALRKPFEFTVPLSIAVLALALRIAFRGSGMSAMLPKTWVMLSVPSASLLYWFLTAPALRFSGALFWGAAAAAVAVALHGASRAHVRGVLFGVCVLLFAQNINPIAFLLEQDRDVGPIPVVPMREQITDHGLKVQVPMSGMECWDAPLPATPFFDARLRLRVPGDLSGGFVLGPKPVVSGPPNTAGN